MYNTQYFVDLAKNAKGKLVVAAPHDSSTLLAVKSAIDLGIIDAVMVGNKAIMNNIAKEEDIDISNMEIIDVRGTDQSNELENIALETVKQITQGNGNILMKGLIDTSILLKAVLKKEYGLRTGKLLSHVGILYKENGDKYYILTDAGMNIHPTLEDKVKLIENSVELAHALGNKNPHVAMLCAKEKAYDKMPATMDAKKLQEMNQNGEITGCVVSGPLQIDNAVSLEASKQKGVEDPVAGNTDIFLVPNIETGNVFGKGLKYLGGFTFAGVVMGAKIPIVLVSRADGASEKLCSIALACALSKEDE